MTVIEVTALYSWRFTFGALLSIKHPLVKGPSQEMLW